MKYKTTKKAKWMSDNTSYKQIWRNENEMKYLFFGNVKDLVFQNFFCLVFYMIAKYVILWKYQYTVIQQDIS